MEIFQFADPNFWDNINSRHQSNGGVYKVIAMDGGQRIPIHRLVGTDINGVLYIGKATSFIDRVIDLKKSISPEYNGTAHTCGRRYKATPIIAKYYPFEKLFIELTQSTTPDELEKKFLNEYMQTFGEVPPLNAVQ